MTYQEVKNTESSVLLGELCGRASRVERFEGHARSGDVRVPPSIEVQNSRVCSLADDVAARGRLSP